MKKSSCKIQFRWTGYTGSKNQVRNRLKIKFVELDFSKLIFQKSSTDQQVDKVPSSLLELEFSSLSLSISPSISAGSSATKFSATTTSSEKQV